MEARTASVIGLGYIGLPVAVAFGKQRKTIDFDINPVRILELKTDYDRTAEVPSEKFISSDILFTNSVDELSQADFNTVAFLRW